ncbi:MAG: response regulator [Acidobacteria bacterium]|nr:response regulator [Acidobacteriota bacterium]
MNTTPRILYVDDDADGCELMAFQLNHYFGYQVDTASSGSHAIEMVRSSPYDVFLLDYCLQDVTAVKLCKQIKEFAPRAPVLIYSALDREIDKEQAFSAGASGFFVKPEDLELIGPELKRLLDVPKIGRKDVDSVFLSEEQKMRSKRFSLRRRSSSII